MARLSTSPCILFLLLALASAFASFTLAPPRVASFVIRGPDFEVNDHLNISLVETVLDETVVCTVLLVGFERSKTFLE